MNTKWYIIVAFVWLQEQLLVQIPSDILLCAFFSVTRMVTSMNTKWYIIVALTRTVTGKNTKWYIIVAFVWLQEWLLVWIPSDILLWLLFSYKNGCGNDMDFITAFGI